MYKSIMKSFVFFVLLFVFAKWGPPINFSSTTQTKGEPFVVSGEGKVTVTPDIAKINLGIQDSGQILKQVQDNVNKKSQTLITTLKSLGISDKDIKTTNYSLYPQYDFGSQTQRITGYQVSINYEVTIKNLDKVNDVLVAVTSSGANMIGQVTFEVNDVTQKEKLQEARVMAVKEAKEKAQGLAGAAGINLGKIININESTNSPRPIMFGVPVASGGMMEKSVAQPNIQPGTTDIDVTVLISFEVR